ncbi:MAG: sugar kinase [Anaerolineae bacterium]|jgi:fructokinase
MTDSGYDLIAIGEVLVDLISDRVVSSLDSAESFRRFLGGQVTNVAWNVRQLGGQAAVIGSVGADGFGNYARQQLGQAGIGIDCLNVTSQAPTTVAVNARQTKTPDFIIYRGADPHIQLEDRHLEAVKASRVVHTSAFALSRDPARSTILELLESAQRHGCLVSLDPNYHPRIWPDVEDAEGILQEAYQWVDVTKPSLDDCVRLFGPGLSPHTCAERFLNWGAEVVALTMGAAGVSLITAGGRAYHIKPSDATVADVTGAGDAFWAGLLMALLDGYPPEEAACLGQIVAEAKIGTVGPMSQMPDRTGLYQQLKSIGRHSIVEPASEWYGI